MSMIDPKGVRPKILGKSKAFELIERDRRLRHELETKVWPVLPPELIQSDNPVPESNVTSALAPAFPTSHLKPALRQAQLHLDIGEVVWTLISDNAGLGAGNSVTLRQRSPRLPDEPTTSALGANQGKYLNFCSARSKDKHLKRELQTAVWVPTMQNLKMYFLVRGIGA